jgi:hypothetical protein
VTLPTNRELNREMLELERQGVSAKEAMRRVFEKYDLTRFPDEPTSPRTVTPEAEATKARTHGARNRSRWKRIEDLLGQVLDDREHRERERVAKILRQRAQHSAWHGGATPSGINTAPPKPRRDRN